MASLKRPERGRSPRGKELNWVQTSPGKAWFTYLRCYGPLEGFLEATWSVREIELRAVGAILL